MTSPKLSDLLVEHSDVLEGHVRRYAGALVRFETVDDLAQLVRVQLLESEAKFEWRGDAAFSAWLSTTVRNCLNNQRAYWNAARRAAGHLLRVTYNAPLQGGAGAQPAARLTGPMTVAERRDELGLAARAVESLLPRDREIIEHELAGNSTDELAVSLDLSEASAARARQRALERFRRAYELISNAT